MEKEKTYTESIDELQLILDRIDAGDLDLDVLSKEVKRASILIKSCKEKLYKTNEDIKKILDKMDQQ